MNKEDSFYIKELQPIREFCFYSDKEDVYKYIYSLQQENQQLKEKVNQLETNRDTAIDYINKLEFEEYGVLYDNGTSIMEYEDNCKETLLEILESGKE